MTLKTNKVYYNGAGAYKLKKYGKYFKVLQADVNMLTKEVSRFKAWNVVYNNLEDAYRHIMVCS